MSGASISVAENLAVAPEAASEIAAKRVEDGRFEEARALVLDGVRLVGKPLKLLAQASTKAQQAALAKALVDEALSPNPKIKSARSRALLWLSIFGAREPALAKAALAAAGDEALSERMALNADDVPAVVPGGELASGVVLDAARMAALFGDAESLAELLRRMKETVVEGGIEEEAATALHWASASPYPEGAECVKMLLAAGADPNRLGYFPETIALSTMSNWVAGSVDGDISALGAAALAGRAEAVEALLDGGARPEASSDGKMLSSPFGLACAFGRVEALEKMAAKIDWDELEKIAEPGAHLTKGLHSGPSAPKFKELFDKRMKGASSKERVLTVALHRQAGMWRSGAGLWLAESGADCSTVLELLTYEKDQDPASRPFVEELAVRMASAPASKGKRLRV